MDPGDLVLRGGRVFDPAAARPLDHAGDVRIAHGRIVEIGRGLVGSRIVDVKDLWVVPGLVLLLFGTFAWALELPSADDPH